MLVWPHEVKPWFHSWYRGKVETLYAHKFSGHMKWNHGLLFTMHLSIIIICARGVIFNGPYTKISHSQNQLVEYSLNSRFCCIHNYCTFDCSTLHSNHSWNTHHYVEDSPMHTSHYEELNKPQQSALSLLASHRTQLGKTSCQ